MSAQSITTPLLRWCGSCVERVVRWTVWLALAVLLGVQLWVATHQELPLPDFALRALERRLAASDVSARFGRAIFDPTGRVVLQDVALFSPDYSTPLLKIRTAYARLDFWALLVGSLRLQEIRLSGVELHLPAMLSPSGTDEALVSDLDGYFRLGHSDYDLDQCTFRLEGVEVSARGRFHLPQTIRSRAGSLPLLDLVFQRYLQAGRKLAALRPRLEALDEPSLALQLTPSETRGAVVDARLFVRGYRQPPQLTLTGISVHTVFPLLGTAPFAVRTRLSADRVNWAGQGGGDRVRVVAVGALTPDHFAFAPQSLRFTAAGGEIRGIPFTAPFADLAVTGWPRVRGRVAADVEGAPQVLQADVDVKRGAGTLAFDGSLPPVVLRQAAAIRGFTAARWVALVDPVRGQVTAELAPGWKPAHAEADVAVGRIEAHDVLLDGVTAHVAYADHRLRVTHLVLRQGANEAHGGYTMDVPTREYRFLLQGRLRPLDVAGWFKEWWPKFWEHFDFPAAPPVADVDVTGRWGAPELSAVFCHVDADRPVVRGVAFDRVRTTLFVRPFFYDVFEFAAEQGGHAAHGRFRLAVEPHQGMYRTLDFAGESDLDPAACARLYGPAGLKYVAPYGFAEPPHAVLDGHLSGPEAPEGRQTRINLGLTAPGRVTVRGVPLDGLRFDAALDNDRLDLNHVQTTIGGGALTGDARLSGPTATRRLAFEGTLRGANLARFIDAVGNYEPIRKAVPARPKGRFLENAANCDLDLALKAEGTLRDYLSYQGKGSAQIRGHDLVDLPVLSALFQVLSASLLNFKSQRLDAAQSDFTIEGPRVLFDPIKVTGPSAEIEGGGVYRIDSRTLDFTARFTPFRKHQFYLTTVLGAALSPLLSTLEMRLTGQLANPSWSLTFLRSLTPRAEGEAKAPGAAAPPPGIQLVPDDAGPAPTPATGSPAGKPPGAPPPKQPPPAP